jgi:serine/threonine protein kinase/predicted negative regulator of RcsB-dependent stress response
LTPVQISHYRIIEKLGAGGMGEVFLAEDLRLERKVAIKVLHAKWIGDVGAKKRLLREAKAAGTLDHPNICTVYEVNEEGENPFIVMQYLDGETLGNKISNNPLAPAEVIRIGIQAVEALAEAHSHGVIHRDIKPQNVIITSRAQVKILDFGLAKQVQTERSPVDSEAKTETRLTEFGQVVGTVAYMSPEQLKGHEIDARSDLFSLGVTLYECVTGESAFSGNSTFEISSQVLHVDPPKPSQIVPAIPPGLEEIVIKAMTKDVEARYQSADAMLEDLQKLQTSLSIGSGMLSVQPRSSQVTAAVTQAWGRKSVKVGAGLALLLIVGILLAAYLWRPAPYQPSPEARTWYDRGLSAMREGTYYQASKNLERSIGLDDQYALSHARLAETYFEMNSTEKAQEELLRANSLASDRSGLSSAESVYLDALGATVRREFPAAIGYYQKILDQANDRDKANAYVDLGRAYEKNENLDKSMECYLEATKRDQQSAAAFLRLGILYGRRQDLKSATEAFGKAETLYQVMSNPEGLAEVQFQRGFLLSKNRELAEAKIQLEKAMATSRTADNRYQLVKTQLQLSSVYYAEGNSERAKEIATEAIEMAQANNIRNLATTGLIDLGYTLISRGELNEARKYFKQALDFAQADKARRTEARAKLALGTVDFQQGNLDQAISFLNQALEFYQSAGYRKETSIALLTLGRAHRNKGEYEIALRSFEQQLQLAKDLNDPAQLAASHLSIAILLGVYQERYPEALPHLDESFRINESITAKIGMSYDQLSRGTILWRLGRNQEADAALKQAFSIASQPEANYKDVLAFVHLTESQMALSGRRFPEARAKAQQAMDLAGTEIRDLAAQAKYTIGLAQALSGAAQPARKLCEEAVAMSREENSPRLVSSALLALAEVLLLGNDAQGALANALEAQAIFARSGQQDSEWRALLIAARASELAGNKSAMKDYASRADSLCAGLKQKWGAEAYDGYLRRSDIQAYRRDLDQVLTRSK